MTEVFSLIAPLFGLMAVGYLAGKIARLPLEGLAWLNFFVIYIALPAMFFNLLSRTPLDGNAGFRLVAVTTLATLLIFCLSFLIAILLQRKSKTGSGTRHIANATIQGFAGAYGNVGYMGPPLALSAFGTPAIGPAALIFSFDNALHFILAPALMAIHHRDGSNKVSLLSITASIVWRIISHPFILATIAGMSAAAFEYTPPGPVDRIIVLLAAAAAPCALFMMGVTAALRPLKRMPVELTYLVPIKLLVHPLLVYVMLISIGGFPTVYIQTAVLLAALPSAANVYIIAEQYGFWRERASSSVVVTTITSVATLSIILYYLKNVF